MEIKKLADAALRQRLREIAASGRRVTTDLLRHLLETDARKAWAGWGYPSLFFYCTEELRFSEAAAYKRITAARWARQFPVVIGFIERGDLHLESLLALGPHLTPENHVALLERASRKSKREVELLVAELAPRPDKPDFSRAAPSLHPAIEGLALASELVPGIQDSVPSMPAVVPSKPVRVEPLSPGRIHIGATIDARVWSKIERVKGLLKHKHPSGRLDDVLDEMAEVFLDAKDPIRRAERRAAKRTDLCRPSPELAPVGRRTLSRTLREEIFRRDGGRCTFVSSEGMRCGAKVGLEIDHVVPQALGGGHEPRNLRTLCRTHNQWAAERIFGPDLVGAHRRGQA